MTKLKRWLTNPRIEVLHMDQDTAKIFGETSTHVRRIGKRVQQKDIWIAALCKQYGYALATKDGGFQAILGLEIIGF